MVAWPGEAGSRMIHAAVILHLDTPDARRSVIRSPGP
jgi:hypothetical protein